MPELVVDERGRTSLARVRSQHYDRYLVEEFPDGTLVLTPLVTVSAVELAALRDPVVRAAIAAAKSGDQGELRRRPRRSVDSSRKLLSRLIVGPRGSGWHHAALYFVHQIAVGIPGGIMPIGGGGLATLRLRAFSFSPSMLISKL